MLSVGSPSSTTVCIDVTILDDVIPEIDHSFTLELSSSPVSVATVAVGGESTTVTIIDDDGNPLLYIYIIIIKWLVYIT